MRIRLCAQQQKRQRRPHRGDPCARAARRGGRPQVPRLVSTHLRSTYSVHTRFQEVRPRTNSSQTERATTVSRRPFSRDPSVSVRWTSSHRELERSHTENGRTNPRFSLRLIAGGRDRKSTRLNSSHLVISYAVFCLKKKKNKQIITTSL